ncbi:Laccase domain protein YfiH [Candidatus Pandoraea novymonadis]|uniref:Purine nucleoside phosphorylase n=2 Tax=Candidatus Pandoraea novymonadis TaxID=1808959 RepID=A0ABX5FER6_9BURK|nr:Laccase domain protein YfiH [Candidatus Pandoraea novymonadis]
MPADWIVPEWPAPANVRAVFTTRSGGVSIGSYATFNVGTHTGDEAVAVESNRVHFTAITGVTPAWILQVHGTHAIDATVVLRESAAGRLIQADASVTSAKGVACTVMTADCLPVLLCDIAGRVVGAVHAGWRGLCSGVIESAVVAMRQHLFGIPHKSGTLLAWLGPCIGSTMFEVSAQVREAFLTAALRSEKIATEAAFVCKLGTDSDKFFGNLCALARLRLARVGVDEVYGGQWCTASDSVRFYSYRRAKITGRQAGFIYLL